MADLISQTRRWLGLSKAKFQFSVSRFCVNILATVSDCLGQLGWRPVLRSASVGVLEKGVGGDTGQTKIALGRAAEPFDRMLDSTPATQADVLYYRMQLMFPVLIAMLSVFWIVSGFIGFVSINPAARVLTDVGWSLGIAKSMVAFWAVIDILIGLDFLLRPLLRAAAVSSILVSCIYLLSASILTPSLWMDPLGPLVKVVPTLFLPLIILAISNER